MTADGIESPPHEDGTKTKGRISAVSASRIPQPFPSADISFIACKRFNIGAESAQFYPARLKINGVTITDEVYKETD